MTRRGPSPRLIHISAVAAVGILAGTAVVLLRESPWPFDPMVYMESASFFFGDRASLPMEHRGLRWGLLLPMGAFQAVFGFSEVSYYAVPVLSAVILAIAVYLLARPVLGGGWSALAGILASTNPLLLSRGTNPFPDTLGTAFFTLGMAAVVRLGSNRRRDLWLSLGAGLSLGYAYATREMVAILFPVVAIALVLVGATWRSWLAVAAGALSFLAVELFVMDAATGDPLARLRVLLERNARTDDLSPQLEERAAITAAFQGTPWLASTALFRKWAEYGPAIVLSLGPIGALAKALTSTRRRRIWLSILAWFVVGWATYSLLGLWQTGRGGYVFNLRQVRYWYLLVPPASIGLVGLFEWAGVTAKARLDRAGFLRLGVAAMALVVVLGGALAGWMAIDPYGSPLQVMAGNTHMSEIRDWLADDGEAFDEVASPTFTRRILNIYDAEPTGAAVWDGRLTRMSEASTPVALVITAEDTNARNVSIDGEEFDRSAPPAEWDLLFVTDDGRAAGLAPATAPNELVATTNALPIDLEPGGARTIFRFAEAPEGDMRFKLTYTGDVPRLRCVSTSPGGGGALALWVADGTEIPGGSTELDVYCPEGTELEVRPDTGGTRVLGLDLISG